MAEAEKQKAVQEGKSPIHVTGPEANAPPRQLRETDIRKAHEKFRGGVRRVYNQRLMLLSGI